MIDAVDQALAHREHLDTGFWRGTGASIVMHVGVAAVLLFGLRSQSSTLIPATPSISSLPVGEILGIPAPARGSSLQSDATVLKPPTAASHRATKAPPASTQRALPTAPVEPIQATVGSTITGGGPPLVLGDSNGVTSPNSWYLAGVQAKVWAVWASEMRPDFVTPVEVQFTILEDGSLADPEVVARSGSFVIDLAATRAIVSAAPFAPLPEEHGDQGHHHPRTFQAGPLRLRGASMPPNKRMKLTERGPTLGGRFRGSALFTKSRSAAYARCWADQ